MFAVLLTLLIAALGAIAAGLHCALRQGKTLKAALAACPETLEMRYTITETVVRWNDGTVVALPLRQRQSRLVPLPAVRAAA